MLFRTHIKVSFEIQIQVNRILFDIICIQQTVRTLTLRFITNVRQRIRTPDRHCLLVEPNLTHVVVNVHKRCNLMQGKLFRVLIFFEITHTGPIFILKIIPPVHYKTRQKTPIRLLTDRYNIVNIHQRISHFCFETLKKQL
uniref:Uncharacterized protein n=1 Tax=Cacopsylla melanoneura TaxID=428564 RepID=A0A8D8SJH1_9HEMI